MLHLLPMGPFPGKNPPEDEEVMFQNGVFHMDPPFGCLFLGPLLGLLSRGFGTPFLTVAGCSFAQTLVVGKLTVNGSRLTGVVARCGGSLPRFG